MSRGIEGSIATGVKGREREMLLLVHYQMELFLSMVLRQLHLVLEKEYHLMVGYRRAGGFHRRLVGFIVVLVGLSSSAGGFVIVGGGFCHRGGGLLSSGGGFLSSIVQVIFQEFDPLLSLVFLH